MSQTDWVVFGEDWGGLPSSTQYFIRHLKQNRRVLWVNSIGLRAPSFTVYDLKRFWKKLFSLVKRSKSASSTPEAFIIVNPIALPWPGHPVARWFNRSILSFQVKRAMKKAGITNPMLWVSLPTAVDCVGRLGERACIYYAGDDFTSLPGLNHKVMERLEDELATKADLILVASPFLVKRFPTGKTHLIHPGVDVDHFRTKQNPPADLPKKDNQPIMGFYGLVERWVDVELLCQMAKRLPDWLLIMIGTIRCDVSELQSQPNVIFLGPKPYEELPGYAQHWDVSLLPFRDSPEVHACNPLKIPEYLAAGRPVVTMDYPALDKYRKLVTVARTPDEFVQGVKSALKEPPENVQKRQASMVEETWQARAREIETLLERLGI